MTTVLYARLNANGDLHRARGEQSEPGAQVERSLIWCLVRQDQLLGSWVTASVLPVLLVWKIFTSHWMLHFNNAKGEPQGDADRRTEEPANSSGPRQG